MASSPVTGDVEMNRARLTHGYTLVELLTVFVVMSVITASTTMLGQRVIARQQLSGAARTLATDLTRARMQAIQKNAPATVRRVEDGYRAAGDYHELPGGVRFDPESADSITFNTLGAVAGGGLRRFVLENRNGESWEVVILVGGAQEVRKL